MAFLDYDGLSHFKDKLDVEAEGKANIDGYYEELTAGSAEQLISTTYVEDNAPYVFRQSADGKDIGDRESNMLIGGTIAWNQLVRITNIRGRTINGLTVTNNNDGSATITGTCSQSDAYFILNTGIPMIVGHKYYITANLIATSNYSITPNNNPLPAGTNGKIINGTNATAGQNINIYVVNGYAINVKVYPQIFDLTQMFGSTIADYIYSLETATEGAGVAWFKKYFPKGYYAYNAGTLMSVNAYSHETTGFNQWDEQWEVGGLTDSGEPSTQTDRIRSKNFIPVLPNTDYYCKFKYGSNQVGIYYYWYDSNKTLIGTFGAFNNTVRTSPSNACYLKFRTYPFTGYTYTSYESGDICINFHRDGSRDGEYEAYDRHSYNLDAELELRGIPKLDTSNNLYYDGDTYESDGSVTRRFGVYNFTGEEDWQQYTAWGSSVTWSISLSPSPKLVSPNAMCNKYCAASQDVVLNGRDSGFWVRTDTNRVYFSDSRFTTKEAVQAILTVGDSFIWELRETTTASATGFTNPQIVNGWGTEEYIDAGVYNSTRDISVPVGHDTQYPADLRGKLQHLPNLASGNGVYVINQEGSSMELSLLDGAVSHKAEIDGTYKDMTVGLAEQLLSDIYEEDSTPYNFRTSGGAADIGDREIDEVVGGTIAWNQYINNVSLNNGGSGSGLTWSVDNTNHTITVNGTSEGRIQLASTGNTQIYKDHVYLMCTGGLTLHTGDWSLTTPSTTNDWAMHKVTNNYYSGINMEVMDAGREFNNKTFHPMIFDLTQMLGSAIANYVYSLETGTLGAGVAWFRNLFPKDYYAYNAGELLSVNTSAHNMTGFNQVHDITYSSPTVQYYGAVGGSIRFIKGCKYCLSVDTEDTGIILYFAYYPKTVEGIASEQINCNGTRCQFTFTMKEDLVVVNQDLLKRLSATSTTASGQLSNLCINISWDGSRDGEYEPYELNSYPLDSSLTLRGIPKLDVSNKLYYDGDTYEADGSVTRRWGNVDLGTLTWTYDSGSAYFKATVTGKLYGTKNIVCAKYNISSSVTVGAMLDKEIKGYPNDDSDRSAIYVKDSAYTDAATFKTAMSGVYLVYELATPTTESAEPYQEIQIVNDFGTEEYVDAGATASTPTRDVAIPVGHDTKYSANLKAKLEMAPNSPDGNGDYILRQADGDNTYVPLIIPEELPTKPTADGNYVLRCTVSSGTPTLSWVSAT